MMLLNTWEGVARTVLVGIIAYSALVAMLRMSGKRTLSKMNAFDLVVTVALGSTLATVLLSKDVALMEGIAAFLTLIILQYVVAWLSMRSKIIRELVKSSPRLLYYQGKFLDDAMSVERVTQEEIYAAIRAQGITSLENTAAVVLETDGTFAVLKKGNGEDISTLKYVQEEL